MARQAPGAISVAKPFGPARYADVNTIPVAFASSWIVPSR